MGSKGPSSVFVSHAVQTGSPVLTLEDVAGHRDPTASKSAPASLGALSPAGEALLLLDPALQPGPKREPGLGTGERVSVDCQPAGPDSGLDTCLNPLKLLEKQTSRSPQIHPGKRNAQVWQKNIGGVCSPRALMEKTSPRLHLLLLWGMQEATLRASCGSPSLSSPHRGQTRGEGDASSRTRG